MDDTVFELDCIIERALQLAKEGNISPSTLKTSYIAPFRRIKKYCEGRSEPCTPGLLAEYAEFAEHCGDVGAWTMPYSYLNRHAALLLIDCATKDEPVLRQYRKNRERYVPSIEFIDMAESVITSMGAISDSHAVRTRRYLRQFFCYLEAVGITGCEDVTDEHIRSFIKDIAEKQPRESEYIISSIRVLMRFLTDRGICHTAIDLGLYKPSVKSPPIIPPFTKDEVRAVLSVLDGETAADKRNKAIILVAVTTGLRGCDIASLRLSDIEWRKGEVHALQKKTSVPVAAPLTVATGNALAGYILNYRPSVKDDHIFLTIKAPHRPLGSAGALDTILENACIRAGVEVVSRRAFHSLRRSVGTWMAEDGAGVHMISQVLGHKSHRSAMPYIAFDPQTLEACPLDFSCVPLAKGGVYAL